MRSSNGIIRSVAVLGLAAAVLIAWNSAANAQIGGSSTYGGSSMGSGGFGGSGGSGGSGLGGGGTGLGGGNSNQSFSFAGGSSFVGGSSSSFSGGSGSSFSGSSGSFSGTSGSGSFGSSSSSGGYGGRGSSQLGGVSSMNAFASSFANPLAGGMPGGNANAAFGTPMFASLVTTPQNMLNNTQNLISSSGGTGTAGIRGGTSGMGGMGGGLGSTSGQTGVSFGALAVFPNASVASLARPGNAGGPANVLSTGGSLATLPPRLQTDLQSLLARSDTVSAATRASLTMGLDGSGALVLRGTAASPGDIRTIETLLKFAPGVYGVRNEMTWKAP